MRLVPIVFLGLVIVFVAIWTANLVLKPPAAISLAEDFGPSRSTQ